MKTVTKLKKTALIMLMGSSFLISPASAQEDLGSKLPPEVRALLIQEMVAVLGSTQTIIDAMVRGEHPIVATEAQRIHDSFILAQELTEEQHAALVEAASKEFLEKDEEFHALGASLAEAAHEEDAPRQQEIFSQMMQACVACHTEHAAQRFPRFHEE